MATVLDARTALLASLRYTIDGISNLQKDLALRWALEKYAKESGYYRAIGTYDTSVDDLTITHGLTRFLPGRLYSNCYITTDDRYTPLANVSLADIQRHLMDSKTTGVPEMITFIGATQAMIYPLADAAYTINFPYERSAVSWTLGDAGADTLDIPEAHLYGGLLDGAKYQLLHGIKDARLESQDAKAAFYDFLDDIRNDDVDQGIDLGSTSMFTESAWLNNEGV